jgi:hypothetical protein
VEAAVEHGPGVYELTLEHVRVGVVEAHRLVPGGDEEVVTVVGEPEVGDPVRRRVGELLAAADGGCWGGGGAHGGRPKGRRNWIVRVSARQEEGSVWGGRGIQI